jgi:hypothetical protein
MTRQQSAGTCALPVMAELRQPYPLSPTAFPALPSPPDAHEVCNLIVCCHSPRAQVSGEKEFFAQMVVDAVSVLDPNTLDLKMIGIKKVQGGGLRDSFLVDGVAFKKTFSYAGGRARAGEGGWRGLRRKQACGGGGGSGAESVRALCPDRLRAAAQVVQQPQDPRAQHRAGAQGAGMGRS